MNWIFFIRIFVYCFKNVFVSFLKDVCGSKWFCYLFLLKYWNFEKVDFVGNYVKVYCKIFCVNVKLIFCWIFYII